MNGTTARDVGVLAAPTKDRSNNNSFPKEGEEATKEKVQQQQQQQQQEDQQEQVVSSSDVLRLIQHYLTERGLHGSCRALREESGVGMTAAPAGSDLRVACRNGRWGDVLSVLSTLDSSCVQALSAGTTTAAATEKNKDWIAEVHEMAVLELAERGDREVARATLRLCADVFASSSSPNNHHNNGVNDEDDYDDEGPDVVSSIEARLRSLEERANTTTTTTTTTDKLVLPPNYYGGQTRQQRRNEIGDALAAAVPRAPRGRLVDLLQQSLKWQVHTGQLARPYDDDDDDDDEEEYLLEKKEESEEERRNRKRRRRKRLAAQPAWDLVLGKPPKTSTTSTSTSTSSMDPTGKSHESIPTDVATSIKFGKRCRPRCCLFLPSGESLVTGSSDGFVEVWDAFTGKLADLPYQRKEELMAHVNDEENDDGNDNDQDDLFGGVLSLAISTNGDVLASGDRWGKVKVWDLLSGNCLRELEVSDRRAAVHSLAFRKEGARLLVGHDHGSCEYGLVAGRRLKEFVTVHDGAGLADGGLGPATVATGSAVYTVSYLYNNNSHKNNKIVVVVTGSADGTVRFWDGSTAELVRTWRPPSSGHLGGLSEPVPPGPIHTVLSLRSEDGLLVVPRGQTAYLIHAYRSTDTPFRTFRAVSSFLTADASSSAPKSKKTNANGPDFVAATLSSPTQRWLYAATSDGNCTVYSVATGTIERTLAATDRITGLVHHPHRGWLATYDGYGDSRSCTQHVSDSNGGKSKKKKGGILQLWD